MNQTLTEETRRRLALGLVRRPSRRNRRHARANILCLTAAAVILAALLLIAKLS